MSILSSIPTVKYNDLQIVGSMQLPIFIKGMPCYKFYSDEIRQIGLHFLYSMKSILEDSNNIDAYLQILAEIGRTDCYFHVSLANTDFKLKFYIFK